VIVGLNFLADWSRPTLKQIKVRAVYSINKLLVFCIIGECSSLILHNLQVMHHCASTLGDCFTKVFSLALLCVTAVTVVCMLMAIIHFFTTYFRVKLFHLKSSKKCWRRCKRGNELMRLCKSRLMVVSRAAKESRARDYRESI